MTVEFEDLKAGAERLQNDVIAQNEKLKTVNQNYDAFKNTMALKLKELGEKIDTLLNNPLSSKEEWEKYQNKDDVIKKVYHDLSDEAETTKDKIEQAVNLMVADTKIPKWLAIIGIFILLSMVGSYIVLHKYIDAPTYKKESGEKLFKTIGKLKAHLSNSDLKPNDIPEILQTFSNCNDPVAKIEVSSNDSQRKEKSTEVTGVATVRSRDALTFVFAERISSLNGFISVVKAGTTTGTSSANAKNQIDKIREELEKIEKDALAFSKNDGFFWIVGFWRWLEIAFWAEFGVIAGILVWICTKAEEGTFTKGRYEKELPWYIAEMAIGPIVVVAVFFLLRQTVGTLIAGVAEEDVQSSIFLTLGISFTLGFFIRRTLGIFNFIKDKLPLP